MARSKVVWPEVRAPLDDLDPSSPEFENAQVRAPRGPEPGDEHRRVLDACRATIEARGGVRSYDY